jgi:hypothetical protein
LVGHGVVPECVQEFNVLLHGIDAEPTEAYEEVLRGELFL